MWFDAKNLVPDVRVLCMFVELVAGLPTLERADERLRADGCMCVSAVFLLEFMQLKAQLLQ